MRCFRMTAPSPAWTARPHLFSGQMLKAEGEGKDAHVAFDAVLAHLEKQVRRYKRRLKNHHEKARPRVAARTAS